MSKDKSQNKSKPTQFRLTEDERAFLLYKGHGSITEGLTKCMKEAGYSANVRYANFIKEDGSVKNERVEEMLQDLDTLAKKIEAESSARSIEEVLGI